MPRTRLLQNCKSRSSDGINAINPIGLEGGGLDTPHNLFLFSKEGVVKDHLEKQTRKK